MISSPISSFPVVDRMSDITERTLCHYIVCVDHVATNYGCVARYNKYTTVNAITSPIRKMVRAKP